MQSEMDLQLVLPSSNASYTFVSPRPQNFSLPYLIMNYIFTNPSSGKAWKKLIQTCKFFFSKNPIYPVECLNYICSIYYHYDGSNKWNADGEIYDPTKNVAKLWIYDEIYVVTCAPLLLSSLIPKIEKCNLCSLDICEQRLTYDEYQFLISSGDLKRLELFSCIISHSDGTMVKLDQLFENIYKLEYFRMRCAENSSSMFKKDTFKKLAGILPDLKELSRFSLYGLTEAFDFSTIIDFIMKNENLSIELSFDEGIPFSSGYKEILENFIAKIIKTPPERIPHISFRGFENSIYNVDYLDLHNSRK